METIGLILLKSAAWLTGFALVFLLVLRNERYFKLNRMYLISGILATLLFPLITFHYAVVLPSVTNSTALAGELSTGVIVPEESTTMPVYFWIYLFGITALSLRLLFQTWKIIRKLQKTGYEQNGAVKLVRTSDYVSSFSFFSFVFVNPSIANVEMQEIMNHEIEHIHQRHWFDLVLVELVCIVQWFNPFAWIYAHFVRQNHEFLADESALQRTTDPAIYQATLLNQLLGVPVFSLANSFSYSLNKKRFKMMKKKIDSPFRKLKVLAVLPVAAFLFYAFSTPEYQFSEENSAISSQVTTIDVKGQVLKNDGTPLPGTSVILKGSTLGTISDPDGNFELKGVPSDGVLFFTFVGFQTKVQKVTTEPMKIQMEISKVGIEEIVVVAYGTPPPPPPPPGKAGKDEVVVVGYGKTQPGTTPPPSKVAIRSIDDANPPLILLDGVPISKATMDKLDPATFESIAVLKDKAGIEKYVKDKTAIEKYGEGAKNGVILIKLKDKYSSGITGDTNQNKNGSNEPVTLVEGRPLPTPANVFLKSTFEGKQPLIIFDGKEIDKKEMDQINPNDIQSISILKDKSATIVYGDKGKDGVILITSKKAALNKFDPANPPLYILDGREVEKATMDHVDPRSTERMLVIKDPKLSASYGEKGKNGVVVMYTKEYAQKNPEIVKEAVRKMAKPTQREDGVYIVVEEMPEFPGKETALRKFIAENIKYPVEAKEKGIQGKVYVTFVVNSTGKVEKAKIARGIDPSLDAEALRVVEQLPEWKPGRQKGEAVNVAYTVPINFALDGNKPGEQLNNPNSGEPQVFVVVEEMPEFPGGEVALRKFIAETIKYPVEAKEKGIMGKVFVTFVITSAGKVERAKIAKSVHPLLDAEALRVVALLPDWKPGMQRGVTVNVSYTIPIMFSLDGNKDVKQTVSFVPPKVNEKGEKEVFVVVEEMPEFPGGALELRRFLAKSVKYPVEAQKAKTQGKVFVSFVVNAQGKVEQPMIEKGVDPALDAEAIRVVGLMPDWKPGTQRGVAVSVSYTIPIQFMLQ